jgi:hypothetical protein
MMNEVLIYIGSGIIMLWGIAHIIPTRAIVKGFGEISADNKKIITMELLSEGMTLIFLGMLPTLVTALTGTQTRAAHIVLVGCAVMLLAMAVLTELTGARTPTIWYKICPVVKTVAAIFFILGGVLG